MLHEAFGEHSLSQTADFEWHSRFKAGWVSVEDDEHSGWRSTSKATGNIEKNLRTHPRRPSLNNPWVSRHHWDQLWSLPGDRYRKFEHAPYCSFITTMCPPTHLWKPQSLWLTTTWLSFSILPTRQT
jgi:hypothetical protein